MTVSDWAAWIGAVTGVMALVWEIIRWSREGPRLLVRTCATMRVYPDDDPRLVLMAWVTNSGSTTVTVTSCTLHTFPTWLRRWRMRPEKSFVVWTNLVGPNLPIELQPGQQWTWGIKQDDELAQLITGGMLYVGVYHASKPTTPVLTHVSPEKPKPTDS